MRDLVRNNPHAAKAVSVLVNNIVGSGIMPRAASGNDKLDCKVNALWEAWSAQCDADGQLDFYRPADPGVPSDGRSGRGAGAPSPAPRT